MTKEKFLETIQKLLQTIWLMLCGIVRNGHRKTLQRKGISTEMRYGIFGTATYKMDRHRFITRLVIIAESGLYAGAPPLELRIHCLVPFDDKRFGKQEVARLNRKTDLPFYLATAKIRVEPMLQKITDEDLIKEGIECLP